MNHAGGRVRSRTSVVAVVDTYVLVYRFEKRFAAKRTIAARLLRREIVERSVLLPSSSSCRS
jgi:hypothetical protein